eukprot:m.133521 g.133521  ORF g.133521 m.133521 type:complete len:108 (+) comp23822_c0_seq1:2-325(+)
MTHTHSHTQTQTQHEILDLGYGLVDTQRRGYFTLDEFKNAAKFFELEHIPAATAKSVFMDMDKNKTGKITKPEFIAYFSHPSHISLLSPTRKSQILEKFATALLLGD